MIRSSASFFRVGDLKTCVIRNYCVQNVSPFYSGIFVSSKLPPFLLIDPPIERSRDFDLYTIQANTYHPAGSIPIAEKIA